MSYFHDEEFSIGDLSIKEKGRLYKNINKDGSFANYTYECKYSVNGISSVETGLIFSDPAWAHASEEDINKAIIRRLKK